MPLGAIFIPALSSLLLALLGSEDPERVFDRQYGKKFEECRRGGDKAAATAFAKQLFADAKQYSSLRAILCEKAYELGVMHPDGCATAVGALDMLAETLPERKVECRERIAAIRKRQYDAARGVMKEILGEALIDAQLECSGAQSEAGDFEKALATCRKASGIAAAIRYQGKTEIEALQTRLSARQTAAKRIAELKKRLAENPAEKEARDELVRLLTVEADNPAAAAEYLNDTSAGDLWYHVPLLARGIAEISESACRDVSDWCQKQAERASPAGKETMLGRALACCERFLALHGERDAARDQADITRRKLAEAIERLSGSARPSAAWIDLLKGVDVENGIGGGTWRAEDIGVSVTTQEIARLPLSMLPEGSFEFAVRFMVKAGKEVDVIFPAGAGSSVFIVNGWSGTVSGLNLIAGKHAPDNETRRQLPQWVPGRISRLTVQAMIAADQAQVTVTLDGKRVVDWSGPQSQLTVWDKWQLRDNRLLGIGAYRADVHFLSARLRMLNGNAVSR